MSKKTIKKARIIISLAILVAVIFPMSASQAEAAQQTNLTSLYGRITALNDRVAAMKTRVTALNSAITTLKQTDITPPVITVLGKNPAVITAGTVYIDEGATASDNVDGNMTSLVTSTSTLNSSTPGNYIIVYSVSDSSGNKSVATRTVFVTAAPSGPDTTAPTVTLAYPLNESVVSGTITITATALDPVVLGQTTSGMKDVHFYLDNKYYSTDTKAPFLASLNTKALTNGTHTLEARAFDNAGNKNSQFVSFTVSNGDIPDITPPTVTVNSPLENTTVSGTITITAAASDPVIAGAVTSGVNYAQFYIDNVWFATDTRVPFSTTKDTATLSDGMHTLIVRVTDKAGNTGFKYAPFNVSNNPLPPPPPQNDNLILNPSLESGTTLPDSWQQGGWGTNDAVFTYPATSHTGSKGAGVTINSFTDGDAKWFFNDVTVNPGEKYAFSDFYQSNIATIVTARFTNSDGTYLYLDLGYPTASATWNQFSYSFTAPQNVVSVTIFHLIAATGYLNVDDFSLTKETVTTSPFSQGMVTFSFDDGWLSAYQNGIPILNSHGIQSTQYIISGALGWDEYITAEQMLDMQSQGHEIGAHSRTHPDLTVLTDQQITDEVLGSKQDLQSLGANAITSFAYPYGAWTDKVKNIVEQSGYKGARTAVIQDGGYNYADQDHYLLKTMSVEADTSAAQVEQWIQEAANSKTWLILVYHQVENNGGQYSTTPQNLESVASYISQNNVKTVTIGEGLNMLSQ